MTLLPWGEGEEIESFFPVKVIVAGLIRVVVGVEVVGAAAADDDDDEGEMETEGTVMVKGKRASSKEVFPTLSYPTTISLVR